MIGQRLKNVLHGVGSVLALFPSSPLETDRYIPLPASDAEALAKDWEVVGNDLRDAMRILAPEVSAPNAERR